MEALQLLLNPAFLTIFVTIFVTIFGGIIAGIVGFFCWIFFTKKQLSDMNDKISKEISLSKDRINDEKMLCEKRFSELEKNIAIINQCIEECLKPAIIEVDTCKNDIATLKKDIAVIQAKLEKNKEDFETKEILEKIVSEYAK